MKPPPVQPPRWAQRLLAWLHPSDTLEEVEGDLAELYTDWYQRFGKTQATLRYVLSVVSMLPPFVRRRQQKQPYYQPSTLNFDMLRNYLIIAWRTLWKQKTNTVINVMGLAVAFSASTLLLLSAWFEFSYDRFHANADRIFRPYLVFNEAEGTYKGSSMPYPFMPTLKADFPEVEKATRYMASSGKVSYRGKELLKDIRCADPDLLTIFSFPMRQGNANTALNGLSNIVISENMANDVFGTENPIGKLLLVTGFGDPKQFVVTGVMTNAPANSTIQYDAFIRIENQPNYADSKNQWNSRNHTVYMALRPGISPAAVDTRLRAFSTTYFQEIIRDLVKNGGRPDERGSVVSIGLQPLTDFHYNTHLTQGQQTGRMYLYTLLIIGLVILLIAAINFINLTLSQSFRRAREVGVRKVLGARRGQLFGQLWGETILTCTIGLLLGLGLASGLLPYFNALFNAKLSLALLTSPATIGAIVAGFGLITMLSGGYPALVMARFPTVDVLKGLFKVGRSGGLRNGLIITQFTIACALISCTFIVLWQLNYLREKPLGFTEDQVISLPVSNDVRGADALRQLRNRMANNPNVVAISGTGINIGRGLDGGESQSRMGFMHNQQEVVTDWVRVDYNYLKALGIKLQAGRDFNPSYATDSTSSVIVTASMARKLGASNPVGTFFKAGANNTIYQVIGVIPDFHLYGLQNKIEPITLHLQQQDAIRYIMVRTSPQGLVSVMKALRTEWQQIAPKSEFLGSFLNENTDRWYRREEQLSQMYGIAAGIAVLLSCMGLFAIALLTIEQRIKEIGVRKVLGASVVSIVTLLSKDFLKLVLVAIVIASPIAWWAMYHWLQNFAYKIDIEWWMFALAGLLAVGIALLTVSFQSVKAALMNPVKSLRSE